LRKLVLMVMVLGMFLSSTAFASFSVVASGPVKQKREERAYNYTLYSPDFSEHGETFRFKYVPGSGNGDIDFDKGTSNKWKYKVTKGMSAYPSTHAMQIKDNATGLVFYTVNVGSYAFIVRYDSNKKKVIKYVSADNYYSPYTGDKKITVINGQLYLISYPFNEGGYSNPEHGYPVAYRLFWDSKANWFGYEDVGSNF
jgi:hypothetical protein